MTSLQSLLLGAIQGLTEFLPISSSGHLLLAKQYIGIPHISIAFDVLLHVATLVVVVWYFRAVVLTIVKQLFFTLKNRMAMRGNAVVIVILKLAVASMFTAAIGGAIYAVLPLNNITLTAIGYVLTATALGVAFAVVKRRASGAVASTLPSNEQLALPRSAMLRKGLPHTSTVPNKRGLNNSRRLDGEAVIPALAAIPWRTVVLLGIVQGFAVIPGVSRAGNTIATARIMGVSDTCAMILSFLLAIPAIIGAMIIQLVDLQLDRGLLVQSVWGMVAAIVCGYGALVILDRVLIAKSKQVFFIPYLVFLAIVGFYGIR